MSLPETRSTLLNVAMNERKRLLRGPRISASVSESSQRLQPGKQHGGSGIWNGVGVTHFLLVQATTYGCRNLFPKLSNAAKVHFTETDFLKVAIRSFSLCGFPSAIKGFGNR